ncbi:pyridoxal phosphate-dependent aminotransferase [Marivirga aurantiaca]|uniref:pyridoxal phosphate-dependent aminotransferase n=1 Tax=Marivirga aurantiaca TaxID=2802615 RepID=UPI00293D86BA|nr:aminotransferase class I/II-fold pyridoxal phosphate-dependent enzyme [Marivirga aurantiaca]
MTEVSEYYLSRKLEEIRWMNATGEKVINLGIGSPDMPPSEETIKVLSRSALNPAHHGYQSYKGIPELREAISLWNQRTYKTTLNPETEILPLMGSKEGIMHISMAFLNPDDEVLVPNPGYPTYTSVSKLLGAKVRPYDLLPASPQAIDMEKLKKEDLSKVKLMWINFPHMPTGRRADETLLAALVELAKEKGFLLCHDNPYSLILNDYPLSIFNVEGAGEVAIELNSFSKSHNMAGWRLGWVAGMESYIKTILTVKSNFDSGMFLPIQHAAIQALQNDDDWHRQQNQEYIQRQVVARQLLDLLGCTYTTDQAGMFVWAKAPGHIKNVEEFVNEILQKAKVFISPGQIFGSNGEGYVRVSLCSSRDLLMEAYQRIETYVKTHTPQL